MKNREREKTIIVMIDHRFGGSTKIRTTIWWSWSWNLLRNLFHLCMDFILWEKELKISTCINFTALKEKLNMFLSDICTYYGHSPVKELDRAVGIVFT